MTKKLRIPDLTAVPDEGSQIAQFVNAILNHAPCHTDSFLLANGNMSSRLDHSQAA